MRPTALGLKALLFVFAVWLAFFATPYANLYFLWLCLFFALALVATCTSQLNLRGIRAELADPGPISAGAPAELRIFVSAAHVARRVSLELRVDGRLVECAPFDEIRGERTLIASLPPMRRGVHRITRVALVSSAPFGLLRVRRGIRAPSELVVHPFAVPVESLFRLRALAVDRDAEVLGLRAHRAGDDPREIHARASARRGALVVREREPRGGEGMTLVLDRRCDAAMLERRLSVVAGFAELVERRSGSLRMVTHGLDQTFAREPTSGMRPFTQLRDWLARADAVLASMPVPSAPTGALAVAELAQDPAIAEAPASDVRPVASRRAAGAETTSMPAWSLLTLVLIDLGFVAITDAVGGPALGFLFALALATPLLVRFRSLLAWRLAWNLAVLALFGLLLRDVLDSSVLSLLEDGLVLAAFCQVHLLNNLHRLQKPDLLVLNSAMIGIVTAFFSHDLVYSPLFAGYVVALCYAMAPGRGTLMRALATLLLTFVAFTLLPRDFERAGFALDALRTMQGRTDGDDVVQEHLPLARDGRAVLTNAIVLRGRVQDGSLGEEPLYLRRNTYVDLAPDGWQLVSREQGALRSTEDPWVLRKSGEWIRIGMSTSCTLRFEQPRVGSTRLLTTLHSARVEVLDEQLPLTATALADGTIRFVPAAGGANLCYEVDVGERPAQRGGKTRGRVPSELMSYVLLGHASSIGGLDQLSAECRRDTRADAPQHVLVETIRANLSAARHYALPGERGCARNLAEFVAGKGDGHCEYFTQALALILRSSRIPCRLVTGFLADEWNERHTELVVRERHAHAWVEVCDPQGGWYTVDATPARDSASAADEGTFGALLASVRSAWARVTGFSEQSRGDLLHALLSWQSAIAACAIAALVLFRRRHLREPLMVRQYRRALGRAGIVPHPPETPRETLARARSLGLAPERLTLLEQATAEHERDRYGG